MFRSAPPLLEPVPEPLSVSASPVTVIPVCNSRAAPLLTIVPAAVPPRALLNRMLTAPLEIVVMPV